VHATRASSVLVITASKKISSKLETAGWCTDERRKGEKEKQKQKQKQNLPGHTAKACSTWSTLDLKDRYVLLVAGLAGHR
jgi:hypothetical protein